MHLRIEKLVVLMTYIVSAGMAYGGEYSEWVSGGEARAEIVIVEDALPQVQLAATELRDHIELMTGVELPVTTAPGGALLPIFVGESRYTRELGVELGDEAGEVYRVLVADDYVMLLGHDEIFPFYPRGYTDSSKRDEELRKWQEFTGEQWDFPFMQFYDPRFFSTEFGFSLFDPSGTLFAVYDVLEQLGVRWYMPHHDFGTVIPEEDTIRVAIQDVELRPEFDRRFLRVGWGSDRETFLWSKRHRLGVSEMVWNCHGTTRVTRFLGETHPEYFALMGGEPLRRGRDGTSLLPRLAPPLRDAMVRYADKFFERYPETRHVSVGPADGFTSIDERDVAAGWLQEERGRTGRLSEYVWTFINDVAAGVGEQYPDKYSMGLAYSFYRQPPQTIDRLEPNLGITYCQNRNGFWDPELQATVTAERERWLELMQNDEFYIWEYYLWHRRNSQLWGVPVIFWSKLQEDMQALHGKSRGEYIEAWPLQTKEMWGLNHMTMVLQARLYWEPDLDMEAFLDDYFTAFYGPAAEPMREFFAFAESVWMRPAGRTISLAGGFLQPQDVDQFFAILARAKELAGDGVYGQRVDLIIEECQPMLTIHQRLTRVGPDFPTPRIERIAAIDGDLSKPAWQKLTGEFHEPVLLTRHLQTAEEVTDPATTVALRWADDDSGLYIAVSCAEPNMANLRPTIRINNSFSIYDEDFVEIFVEQPQRAPFRIVINALGTVLTQATDPAVDPGDMDWDPEMDMAVLRHDDRWDIELFIPRDGLDEAAPSTADAPWGINVCRTRFVDGRAQNSAIAPTGGRFLTPAKFGNVVVE